MGGFKLARPAADEYADFYGRYVALVPDGDILELLAVQATETQALLRPLGPEQASERIFAYRALCFARGDETPLPGFDEAAYVPNGGFERRGLADVLDELRVVRQSTILLFHGLDEAASLRRGSANGSPMTARAAAWVIAGHERHHLGVLRTRYGVG